MRPTSDTLDPHVDANFAGNWDSAIAEDDLSTAHSRHGHMLMCCGCPLMWALQLQSEIALSGCESEHTGLSHALRVAILIMELLKEMKTQGFDIEAAKPLVH